MSDMTFWTPRVGEMIKRRNDSDAPHHTVTAVRGSGRSCTLLIDGNAKRWWDGDMFESAEPVVERRPIESSFDFEVETAPAARPEEPGHGEALPLAEELEDAPAAAPREP